MSDRPNSRPSDKNASRCSAVSRKEQELAALRLRMAQVKRQLHEASARDQSIREGTVGRAVWSLIEQGRLEPSLVDLVRDQMRPAMTTRRAAAFRGTVFELPTMPVGLVPEMEEAEVAVPLTEPDVPTVRRSPIAPCGLPRRMPK